MLSHRKKIMQSERIVEPHMNIDNDDERRREKNTRKYIFPPSFCPFSN